MVVVDPVQRAILENQIILAEALWMLIHKQGDNTGGLSNVSARIAATRELLEHDEIKVHGKHVRKRLVDIDLIHKVQAALCTVEEGEGLVEVARNAHRAEVELAKKGKV